MRRAAVTLVLGGLLVSATLAAVALASEPSDREQRSRVIDRTARCSVPLRAGLRLVMVSGQSGVRDQEDPSKWFALASIGLSVQGGSLVLTQAGTPRTERADRVPQFNESFWLNTQLCRPTTGRVAFSPRRLGGGRLNQFAESYDCTMPKRILLRVRAEFRSPVTLRSRSGLLITAEPLKMGQVAVQTERGKPLLYGDVLESGRARLFVAGNCVRD
jgi:hypothetical protein